MSILFRYVLRSFLLPAALCLVGLCALTLLFMSFDLIAACFDPRSAVTASMAFSYLGGTLSAYLEWLLPAVFLLSTLYTMWQFCRHSELIAMRAGGIGMGTVCAPILLVAVLAAAFSFVNTEYIKPDAAVRARVIKDSDFRKTGYEPMEGIGFAAPGGTHIWAIGTFDPSEPDRLAGCVRLTLFREDGSKEVSYDAPTARWLDGAWWLEGGVRATYYDELDTVIPPPKGLVATMPVKAMYSLKETPRDILAQNTDAETASAASRRVNRKIRSKSGLTTRQKNEDSYATYNHFAAPFSIVLVTLFAIPAGIASGRQSVFKGILLAIGLFLSYYIMTALSMLLAHNDIVKPAVAVALPAAFFGAAALLLFRKLR